MFNRQTLICLAALALTSACGDDDGVAPPVGDAGLDAAFYASISGLVKSSDNSPVAGATVTIRGTTLTTTTGPAGAFTLDDVPGEDVYLEVSAAGHWGEISRLTIVEGGVTGVSVELLEDGEVSGTLQQIERLPDTAKGLVIVQFALPAGGEGASISATSDDAFVFNASVEPIEQATLFAGGGNEVLFSNVTLESTTVAVTSGSTTTCAVDFDGLSWPVLAKTTTRVGAACAAAAR